MIKTGTIGEVDSVIDETIDKRKALLSQRYNNCTLLDRQFEILDVIKVANLCFFYIMFGSREQHEQLKPNQPYYLEGINILFDQVFCDFTKNEFAPTFLTQEVEKIHALIIFCGEIGFFNRIKDYCKYNLIEYTGKSEHKLCFRFVNRYMGLENLEIMEDMIRTEKIIKAQEEAVKTDSDQRAKITKRMRKYVKPRRKHFISYDTNPEIDEYYIRLAELYMERTFQFECFPGDVKFGGIPYSIYIRSAVLIISFALKHIAYAQLLTQKHRKIAFVNVLTINRDISEMVEVFCIACGISRNDARQVLDCFTLTYEKYSFHRRNMDYLLMPYIIVSKTQLVFSIAGALSGIYTFLMGELNRKFQKDWDRNILERESQFRNDLYNLFDDSLYIKIGHNLPVQSDGKTITDIDACIVEKATGQIIFFQLKWQEQYGRNIGRRQSRMQNFLRETNRWINDMTIWLGKKDRRKLASMLGLKEKQIDFDKFSLIVAGKYSAHFSGLDKPDDRAEWVLWLQLQRLYDEDSTTFRSLETLIKKLKEDNPYNRLPEQKGQLFHAKETDIEIAPYSAD
ncbi:hypothetical protein HSX37_16505|uniref:Uncharacterized protein n=1 Tax=Dendrosporobacter quercicolus TaxID=146817 RepID=A0A1H0AJI4_9FIRM|nr:hypothetical protein [Dendrosporobacter quercicolus]NSL49638.1 hypothetical protein [Dendrosporobacter quercicolus DSM 1736]SDN33742.1 hypothetical protein SAMN04488502_1196 [Dendrosporobacter quercicolus]